MPTFVTVASGKLEVGRGSEPGLGWVLRCLPFTSFLSLKESFIAHIGGPFCHLQISYSRVMISQMLLYKLSLKVTLGHWLILAWVFLLLLWEKVSLTLKSLEPHLKPLELMQMTKGLVGLTPYLKPHLFTFIMLVGFS